MKRSWRPPPHGLVQCVQPLQGSILQPTDRSASTPPSRTNAIIAPEDVQPTLVLVLNHYTATHFTVPPSLSSTSSFLLPCFRRTLSDFAPPPLNGFWAGATPEPRLQLHHAGPDGVAFAAGLVALAPLGPVGDGAVNSWVGTQDKRQKKKKKMADAGWLQHMICTVITGL